MRRTALIVLLFVLVVWSAPADTIVLKNCRRIIASNVTEDGDHVTYETPAGQMSIPKSIVERIDRDNLGYSSAAAASSVPPISVAAVDPARGYDEVARLTVHDNAIDFAYIAQLDAAKVFPKPIVTQVVPLKGFYDAESYHQDYALHNPDNPYIEVCDRPKIEALKAEFPELFVDYKGKR